MNEETKKLVDTDELIEIMDGDRELLRECFDDFINDSPGMLADIKNSIDAGDAAELGKTAHRFKGTLKYLAAIPTADIAYKLETMGKEGDLRHAHDIFNNLIEECKKLKDFMIQY